MTNSFQEEIDTTKNHKYEVLTFEWFKIKNLHRIKAIIRKELILETEKIIFLFGRHEDCFQKFGDKVSFEFKSKVLALKNC